jgi:hypothetical protein
MAVKWMKKPEKHDYDAAASYLGLVMDSGRARQLADRLKNTEASVFKAKDILRASQLDLLGKTNLHVKSDLAKIAAGQEISPILLVRTGKGAPGRLVVADGYHRVCASYWTDENTDIPCHIVDLKDAAKHKKRL